MRFFQKIAIPLLIVFFTVVPANAVPLPEVVENVMRGVVIINNVSVNKETQTFQSGQGTGFLIAENVIITNDHVVRAPNGKHGQILIQYMHDPDIYRAIVIAGVKESDLAIVAMLPEEWQRFIRKNKPTFLKFQTSRYLRPGEKVFAIGHPWGLKYTVSEGIVSYKWRRIDTTSQFFIQSTLKIYSGNSGGPLFNEDGFVIGVNSKFVVGQKAGSYGFSIASDYVGKVLFDMIRYDGKVNWFSLKIKAKETREGVEITKTDPRIRRWVRDGDVVVSIRTPYTKGVRKVAYFEDIFTEVVLLKSNDWVVFGIKRRGKIIKIRIMTKKFMSLEKS